WWSGDEDLKTFARYAQEIKLDPTAFEACLHDPQIDARIQANIDEARQYGLIATPSFRINQKIQSGAPTYTYWQTNLDKMLAEQVSTPGQPLAHEQQGLAYLAADRLDLALTEFNAALQADPSRAELYVDRGRTY